MYKKLITLISTTIIMGFTAPLNIVHASSILNTNESAESKTELSKSDNQNNEAITLQEMLDDSNMDLAEKSVVTNTFLRGLKSEFNTRSMPRSRYYTIHQDLSRSQIKKIANSGNKVTTLVGYLPGAIGTSAGLIYGNYYGMFTTAAINGWGIRITITSDSYNPTSTGTTFKVSYLK